VLDIVTLFQAATIAQLVNPADPEIIKSLNMISDPDQKEAFWTDKWHVSLTGSLSS
jgi:hypothetical protein